MRFIICEKDNAAKRISEILSNGKVTKTKSGKVPIYYFFWKNEETKCIGLRGHILNMDFPKKYNSWSAVDPSSLIKVEPIKTVSEEGIAKVLVSLAKESSEIYVATDYDREGELIGGEAVEYALGKDAVDMALRTRFSSLTPDDVRSSFREPTRVDKALASAAETRQIVDLVWGATLTRFVSITADRLGYEFLSVGRVQSPTLALLVDKEKEIKAFVPVPYWRIEALFARLGKEFPGNHSGGDFKDEKEAKKVFEIVQGAEKGTITEVKKRERTDQPPTPFNTTQFIRAANTIGMSAARIMSIAENLYTSGYISYPRTDNTVYPKGLDIKKTVESLNNGPYSDACGHILSKKTLRPTRGKKETTDHPPIYPTSYATKGELGPEKFKLYDLIVRRFLATLHDPAKVELTSLRIDVSSEIFNASGLVTLYAGWKSVYSFLKVKESKLPPLNKGDEISVKDMQLLKKETRPPNRFSQGGLIQEMERLGLGTKSTRHEIIKKLYDRRYIDDTPPKPTISGEALVNSLEKHAKMITEHQMTSRLEEDMEHISEGRLTQEEVLEESRGMLSQVMKELKDNEKAIGKELRDAFDVQDVVGKCPRCNNDLVQIRSKRGKRYVRCSMHPGCSKSYPLPQKGKIGFTNEVCEVCRSPIITMYRKRSRPFDTCINPKCPSKEERGKNDEKKEN
ncbi:MAG: DNA topoisomerase I [Candidatus Thermoplasmatota archaeon]|nr:DNA topoisomerase I [Candidatus Thermoplasmatota archaeon]